MNKRLVVLCFIVGIAMMILAFPEGFAAALLVLVCSSIVIFIIRQQFKEDSDYLIQIFLLALLARLIFGLLIHIFDLRTFFGGDAITYDVLGERLMTIWSGQQVPNDYLTKIALATSGPGWGMSKIVGGIYFLVGRNILAAQSFCGVLGAATVPMIYSCALKIFNNRRVGQISALLVALYPAFIIWTGQLLKDGLIIFLLVLAMTIVLLIQEKFRYTYVFLLIFSLLGIISLRFYIFYMVAVAIVGAFIVGISNSPQSIMRRVGALVIIGIGLTYFGVIKNAGSEIDEFANLDRIERSRSDLASSADSGFGGNLDVSTTGGALAALPIGFAYLMFAPFPWEMSNFRQAIALPEILVWWASIPFLIGGLIYTIRHRLRKAIPVLIFALMLTLAYSLFQGNVGTAYRQRTQIQVFLFMFIAVSWTMREEKQENRRLMKQIKRNQFANRSGIGGVEDLRLERTDK